MPFVNLLRIQKFFMLFDLFFTFPEPFLHKLRYNLQM